MKIQYTIFVTCKGLANKNYCFEKEEWIEIDYSFFQTLMLPVLNCTV